MFCMVSQMRKWTQSFSLTRSLWNYCNILVLVLHFIGLEVAQGVHIHFDAAAYEIHYI